MLLQAVCFCHGTPSFRNRLAKNRFEERTPPRSRPCLLPRKMMRKSSSSASSGLTLRFSSLGESKAFDRKSQHAACLSRNNQGQIIH